MAETQGLQDLPHLSFPLGVIVKREKDDASNAAARGVLIR